MALSSFHRPRKTSHTSAMLSRSTLLSLLLLSLFLLFLCYAPSLPSPPLSKQTKHFTGDLRDITFSWNTLPFAFSKPPPLSLKIAVFSRKWPSVSSPGGMERHALTLHSALAARGHRVHVFTSPPPPDSTSLSTQSETGPHLHFLDGPPGQWRCDEAWTLYETESENDPFDVIHSESVAVFHRWARDVPNLVVSWHGISLEALHSGIYQDLTRGPGEKMAPAFNKSLAQSIYKVLDEIRFFRNYAHHVAISDSTGEMLRDVYQLPNRRVHVILNGVDQEQFGPDYELGRTFRDDIGLPKSAELVIGVSGRLVKDKGHPLLFEAFSKLALRHPNVFLIVAGSGPWAQRYADLGRNAKVLGAVPPTRLKAFYNSLDVFVDPTLRPQGLDLTLMEAMQCGKPVLATRFPSIKGSIVVDDEFGFMFSPNADSLLEQLEVVVAEGVTRLAERGRACREYAKRMFTAQKMALAYERLFLCVKNETYCGYPLRFD
ncbi:D-inositol 3-phosphate glycosyltransferase [Rhynchospora pubera]|uniref:D-inositol 3-phosphate glycosyltransferase n=2 Tax=Rhynchospora pubera TaxID=906938 RepID=A0AAV8GK39_9POAL|nr:D-inositol 3-phosphate glycosyltransferase [Rhynchospora pubera]KAJ4771034.1 D-inositol 3-phosphate glycosyltransferase [Rhynchospora pubera]KAJ4787947.1 D-inositol 3-phosphate glycosyltransferase [Rhynchospora pubera]KAJ4804261.1 D-inositol 3-phosphate glycosyltransferase [Rhynchospora pubera]